MLKKNSQCNVCKLIDTNPKLLKDIYNTSYYMKGSSNSLRTLHADFSQANGSQFSYESLLNHVKKHQFMSDKDFNDRHLRDIAKSAERAILTKAIESKQVWDEVINKGMEKLEAGEITMKTADLLKAAKDKSDYELKVKDQQLAMADMIYHFASGANTESRSYDRRIIEGQTPEDFDPTQGLTGVDSPGQERPGTVYYPPAWDAAAPGPGEVPAGDDF